MNNTDTPETVAGAPAADAAAKPKRRTKAQIEADSNAALAAGETPKPKRKTKADDGQPGTLDALVRRALAHLMSRP